MFAGLCLQKRASVQESILCQQEQGIIPSVLTLSNMQEVHETSRKLKELSVQSSRTVTLSLCQLLKTNLENLLKGNSNLTLEYLDI